MPPDNKIPLFSDVKNLGQRMISELSRAWKERDWVWLLIWILFLLAAIYSAFLAFSALYQSAQTPVASHGFATTTTVYYGNSGTTVIELDGSGYLYAHDRYSRKWISIFDYVTERPTTFELDLSNEIALMLNPQIKLYDDPQEDVFGEFAPHMTSAFIINPGDIYVFSLSSPDRVLYSGGRRFLIHLTKIHNFEEGMGHSYTFHITEQ